MILELGVASLMGWLNNMFRMQIIIILILNLCSFNLILTFKYRLFSENCLQMSPFLLPSTYRTGYSPALSAILTKIQPHFSKKALKTKKEAKNSATKFFPSF